MSYKSTSRILLRNASILLRDEIDSNLASTGTYKHRSLIIYYFLTARCTVKAATYVECQVLEKTEFIKLMVTYPNLVERVKHEIQQRIHRSHKIKMSWDDSSFLSLNIYASRDREKSSIKRLKDKLRYLQGEVKYKT